MSLHEIRAYLQANPVVPAYTVEDGLEVRVLTHDVKAAADPFRADFAYCPRIVGGHGRPDCHLTLAHLTEFMDFFTRNRFSGGNYRKVKDDARWRDFYGYAPMTFNVTNNLGVPATLTAPGVPCRECGIHLQSKLVSVDHQVPVSLGGTNYAILKVFRALGLTESPPQGGKGRMTRAEWARKVGGSTIAFGPDKDALNKPGTLYYSVIRGAGMLGRLRAACLHNFVNLRPVCTFCNSSLRDLYA